MVRINSKVETFGYALKPNSATPASIKNHSDVKLQTQQQQRQELS